MNSRSEFLLCILISGCDCGGGGGRGPDGDAGPQDGGDGGGCEAVREVTFEPTEVGLVPGARRSVTLALGRTAECDKTVDLAVADADVATAPDSVTIATDLRVVSVRIDAVAVGETTVTATVEGVTGTLRVVVVDPAPIPCAGESVSGTLAAGTEVRAKDGALAGASISLPETAVEIASVDVTLDCVDDILPDGYVRLGPAVRISPVGQRWLREVPVTIPMRSALLPEFGGRSSVLLFYQAPSVGARVVPLANTTILGAPEASEAYFESPRLGTFQAAANPAVGTRVVNRRYVFRGITGVSMGAGGAASVGFRHPEEFDFVAPLGGPVDWEYMLHYIQTYHLGGFCTASTGTIGEHCPVPPSDQIFEHVQEYENWFYQDGYEGQGGTFDRDEYIDIFNDLAFAYGNPNTDNPDHFLLPPGVAPSELERSDADRCADPVVLADFHDDEYNPDGSYPVITFCDGPEVAGDHGRWDPAVASYHPMSVALAVDVDGDGVRGAGEPIIRNGHEPFDDWGVDAAASSAEAGYDVATNPDPAGDDYDWQFNPGGRENNWVWDEGEPYRDWGLDGVADTLQTDEAGYDSGEDDGVFTWAAGADIFLERSPRRLLRDLSEEGLDALEFYADAGIRDLFNFGVDTHHFLAEVIDRRPEDVRIYNQFSGIAGDLDGDDGDFLPQDPDYGDVGKYAFLRYGSLDATEAELIRGDGGHVGTVTQAINRFTSISYYMSKRWPGGDYTEWNQEINLGDCGVDYACDIEFTAPTSGRTGPVSILLPPGYHEADEADTFYPVVYFGHGYGQEPGDLKALALIFMNYMVSPILPPDQRIQKFIMVFPDGRCRPEGVECVNGTFYLESIHEGGARMETFLLDLVEYMDDNFRTREPEDVEIRY